MRYASQAGNTAANKKPAGSANYQTGRGAVFQTLPRNLSPAPAMQETLTVGLPTASPTSTGEA